MMQKFTALALTFGIIGCGPAGIDQANFKGTIEERAAATAVEQNYYLPVDVGGPLFVAARAEGRELIFEVQMPIRGVGNVDPTYLTKLLRPAACDGESKEFIKAGGVVAFDVNDPRTGRKLPAVKVANCSGY